MSADTSHLLICSCERTMPLDAQAIGRGCAGKITQATSSAARSLSGSSKRLPTAHGRAASFDPAAAGFAR